MTTRFSVSSHLWCLRQTAIRKVDDRQQNDLQQLSSPLLDLSTHSAAHMGPILRSLQERLALGMAPADPGLEARDGVILDTVELGTPLLQEIGLP